jgi:hypothetical protein
MTTNLHYSNGREEGQLTAKVSLILAPVLNGSGVVALNTM